VKSAARPARIVLEGWSILINEDWFEALERAKNVVVERRNPRSREVHGGERKSAKCEALTWPHR